MHSNGTFNEFQIIVGQQRLTTISPLLLATYHLMKSGVVVPQQENLADIIYETYLINKWQKNSRRIRLKTVKKDQSAFEMLFNGEDKHIPASKPTIN